MRKLSTCLIGLVVLSSLGGFVPISAQVQEIAENQNAAAVWQALLRLRTTVTVLHTTAHPDDENEALLAWLSRGQGVRTGLLTLTRGEGGANLIGPELFDALGILRTEELLAAGRYYGVDQFFTRVVDFGFSKRLDETLEKWGRETVLRDVVRVIRLYRPDIIISRFRGDPSDGHGNHQAAGVITREAFRAAADPNRFPEHFAEGLRPWQAKKLYVAPFRFGVADRESPTLEIETGMYDPLLGRTYREIGREGLSRQRSQGAGQARAPRGSSRVALQLVDTTLPRVEREASLFDGLETSWLGLAKLAAPALDLRSELAEVQTLVEGAITSFDARHPWIVVPQLTAGLRRTRALIERVERASLEEGAKDHLLFLLRNKEREFMEAMNKALGMAFDVLVDPSEEGEGFPSNAQWMRLRETFSVAIPGQRFTLTATAINRSPIRVEPVEIALRTPAGWRVRSLQQELRPLERNDQARARFEVTVPEDAEPTRPYWSRASEYHDAVYLIHKPEFLNLPWPPPEVVGVFTYRVDGVIFTVMQPAQTIFVDRPWGEQRRLLMVAPPISVTVSPRIGIIPSGVTRLPYPVRVEVRNAVKGAAEGKVRLRVPLGWTVSPPEATFRFTYEGEIRTFAFHLSIPRVEAGKSYRVHAVAEYNGREYAEGYQVIAYRELEPRHLYRPATIELRGVDVKVAPGLTIGYIMGVGDDVPEALAQLGVTVRLLDSSYLATGNLEVFDAIVIGIRAYAVRDDLKAYNRRVLDYVERGGVLIVQYQTQEFDAAPFGPYPYLLGARAEEVSEEDAPVTILDPTHPIFTWPNRITAADFEGWVEQRGSKFMTQWDSRYQPLLMSHDRGQEPQRGGMLAARYGRGTYIYAAYAFYRQLPAGVAGAYRLFANMISLRRAKP
ncbi:MAG: PIG-L family deacetylase [Blastocatellia bacterium]|nr:PIG-L family deacetylase [Blastocatellia bacterium]